MLHFFSCCTLFMYCTISCCTFTRCSVLVLHFSLIVLFACCNFSCYTLFTLFMLHYFNKCSQDLHKHLRWRALQQNLTKLKIKINISILDVPGESGSASTTPCCTFFLLRFLMLHFFNIEIYWKWTKYRKYNQKSDVALRTVNLFHFYFDII